MCSLPLGKPTARLLQEADIIIWDEAPIMVSHKHLFEATDRSLRDIMKEVSPELGSLPFGGKVAVMGGDFRNNLKLIVTLHHFVHPLWFDNKGGFTNEANIPHFVKFYETAFREYHEKVHLWITFNECNVMLDERRG
ncbi:g6017 [Coccomyxa elongata]